MKKYNKLIGLQTIIILSTQFTNRFDGIKPASLIYAAEYFGDDEVYVKEFETNLIEETAAQTDFWDCVLGYEERFSIKVTVLGSKDDITEYQDHLSKLITDEIVRRAGRKPESSFWDKYKNPTQEEEGN